MKKRFLFFTFYFLLFTSAFTQEKKAFTHADTLRGSITPERAWWDVLRYDITVKPDYENKTIEGTVKIVFKIIESKLPDMDQIGAVMQVDLQSPLVIDEINTNNHSVTFEKIDSNVWYVYRKLQVIPKEKTKSIFFPNDSITINYHGTPHEAIKPPWDNGWIWKKDSLGRPWMTVTCEDIGASIWYPCKDIQSDEPDNGASLSIIVPDTLIAVGNGRLSSKQKNNDGTTTYKWEVKNPINNYDIIPYIGKYVNFSDTMHGEKGTLDLNYWVLDYDLDAAKKQFEQVKPMLHNLEYWFGPYPFYEDSYKLVEAPHSGMEHQSAVAYGNGFKNGYHNADVSGTGWGMKWDFIIEHESSHEWFGNSITSKDIADMWIHEAFASYSETLYTEYLFGKKAGNEYNVGIRKNIKNNEPIIGPYNVNYETEGNDKYYKGSNMLQAIRHIINDDGKWRSILRGLNKTFYHQTVTSKQIENYISNHSGFDLSKMFDQYLLRTIQIPQLSYYYADDNKKVYYRWDSCIAGFNMPLTLLHDGKSLRIYPTQTWKSLNNVSFFDTNWIEKNYYIRIKEVKMK